MRADKYPIGVVHAAERIAMDEKAASAVRRKSQSSIGILTQLHKEGKLDAIFSAGNTGAVVTTALLSLGRLEPVSRPALGFVMRELMRRNRLRDGLGSLDLPKHGSAPGAGSVRTRPEQQRRCHRRPGR